MASDPNAPRAVAWRDDWIKHVPVAVVLALVIQSAAIIWWASTITAEVNAMRMELSDIAANGSAPLQVRVSRLEVQVANEHDVNTRMQAELDSHETNDAERFRRRP